MTSSYERISEMSKTVYAWCITRTSNAFEAEDLSQDILLAMIQAVPNLKNEEAFYGFMWSVARHVYSQWFRKKVRTQTALLSYETTASVDPFDILDSSEDFYLLRRELSLLNHRYRKAAVLYYVKRMKVKEIAQSMSLSESMVKYLLFKTRHLLREGMNMERPYGEQSYHPRKLSLQYWGHGPNHYYDVANTLLRQNILFACYNDALTAQQIALMLGVSLPYLEDDLSVLHQTGLLTKNQMEKYQTNIILFTEDFVREANALVMPEAVRIAECIKHCLNEKEQAIRTLGFHGSNMNHTAYVWQLTSLLIRHAVIEIAGEKSAPNLPTDQWGVPCLCWGVEYSDIQDSFDFGVCQMSNSNNDFVQFMDFFCNGEMVHHTLCKQSVANVFLQLAQENSTPLAENDEAIAAELIHKGYILRQNNSLHVHCPTFNASTYAKLLEFIDSDAKEIADISLLILSKEAALLREHVPMHLKSLASDMAYFRLFADAISKPVSLLFAEHFLPDAKTADMLPTTYVVLNT